MIRRDDGSSAVVIGNMSLTRKVDKGSMRSMDCVCEQGSFWHERTSMKVGSEKTRLAIAGLKKVSKTRWHSGDLPAETCMVASIFILGYYMSIGIMDWIVRCGYGVSFELAFFISLAVFSLQAGFIKSASEVRGWGEEWSWSPSEWQAELVSSLNGKEVSESERAALVKTAGDGERPPRVRRGM